MGRTAPDLTCTKIKICISYMFQTALRKARCFTLFRVHLFDVLRLRHRLETDEREARGTGAPAAPAAASVLVTPTAAQSRVRGSEAAAILVSTSFLLASLAFFSSIADADPVAAGSELKEPAAAWEALVPGCSAGEKNTCRSSRACQPRARSRWLSGPSQTLSSGAQ